MSAQAALAALKENLYMALLPTEKRARIT
jgi:hypothetical protein